MVKASRVPEHWAELPDEQLLDLRMCDLPIALPGSVMQGRIAELQAELDTRELRVPVHYYLAEEWFTPDGATSIAVPFYLAHPRLEKLERAQMLEVEGGDYEWCMRILRHEAGHVVDNAYKLRLKRLRKLLFGLPSEPYPEFYTPKPYSKSFVMHIDPWYAQSHPDEDFAETFAVWLTPGAHWQERYLGWPAAKKLEYVDGLMPRCATRRCWSTRRPRSTPCAMPARPCASTTGASAATTASSGRSSTTASCGGSSPMRPSTPATCRRCSS